MKTSDVLRAARAAARQPGTLLTATDCGRIAVSEILKNLEERGRAYITIAEGNFEAAIERAEFDEAYPDFRPQPQKAANSNPVELEVE